MLQSQLNYVAECGPKDGAQGGEAENWNNNDGDKEGELLQPVGDAPLTVCDGKASGEASPKSQG